MTTSIIVPIYALDEQNVAMAANALLSFKLNTPEMHELIVVDNGSMKPNPFRDLADICLRLDPNRGFAGGVNAGLRVAIGDYIAVGSADIEVPLGWLTPMIEALEEHPGLATPMEEGVIERGKIDARRNGGGSGFFGPLWVMPREVVDTIGPLDEERFPLALSDTAYAMEADMAGYWVGRVPSVEIRQIAKHHAAHLMDKEQMEDEHARLVARYGHRFYGHWKAARVKA